MEARPKGPSAFVAPEFTAHYACKNAEMNLKSTTTNRFNLLIINSLGSFSNDDGNDSEDIKKAIGFLGKTTSLHVHHAFCTFLYRPCTTTT